MNIDQYKELCIKEITGNISKEEKQVLDNWLTSSNENGKEYRKLKEIWIASEEKEFSGSIDADIEWIKLNEKLRVFENNKRVKESFFKQIFPAIPRLKPIFITVSILFLALIGIYLFNRNVPESQLNLISTANKEQKNIQLPDGSIVYLNNSSSIEFLSQSNGSTKIFKNKERKVTLIGEAYFSVTKNSHPFNVTTENAVITVLGTKFDVLSRDKITRVVVKEGNVKVEQKKAVKNVYLSKNQLSTVAQNSEPSQPKNVDSDYFLEWMKGSLVFYRTSLNEIKQEFERFYNIKISLTDDSFKKLTLTGSIRNSSADSSLSMVCLALGLDFQKQNGSYIIKTKK